MTGLASNVTEPSTVKRKGTVGVVDTAGRSFQLMVASGAPITVQWLTTSCFEGFSPASLGGKRVKVEGQLSGAVLTARKIEIDD